MNESRSFPDAFPLDGLTAAPATSRADPQHLARRTDFRLGAATIRPSVRTIDGPVASLAAEPLVMQVLLTLVDAAGNVVSRDDLIRSCWKGRFVGDDSINRTIAEIRRLVRETGADFAVETIPRVGYRISADASPLAGTGPETGRPEVETARAPVSRRLMIAGALAGIAGAGAIYSFRTRSPDPADALLEESRTVALAGTAEANRKSIALLEQAVSLSPEHAEAWGLLAMTRARADEHAMTDVSTPAADVAAASKRALALDPNNADAKAALAMMVPYYGDWLAAERRFDAVLRDHPDHLFTQDSRSFFLGSVGRMRESGLARQSLQGREPLDAGIMFREVYGRWFLGRVDEADRMALRGLEMWPGHAGLWFARLWVLAGTGRFDRAMAHVEESVGRPKLPPPMVATLSAAIGAAATRDPNAVNKATRQVIAGVEKSVAGVVNALMLLNLMRATDAAFDVAHAYYLEDGPIIAAMQWRPGQPNVPDQRRRKTNMLFTPVATAMQKDERFLPLMERMGLQDYWSKRGIKPDFMSA